MHHHRCLPQWAFPLGWVVQTSCLRTNHQVQILSLLEIKSVCWIPLPLLSCSTSLILKRCHLCTLQVDLVARVLSCCTSSQIRGSYFAAAQWCANSFERPSFFRRWPFDRIAKQLTLIESSCLRRQNQPCPWPCYAQAFQTLLGLLLPQPRVAPRHPCPLVDSCIAGAAHKLRQSYACHEAQLRGLPILRIFWTRGKERIFELLLNIDRLFPTRSCF